MTFNNEKKTVQGLTEAFEEVIFDLQKSNWATGGRLHSAKHAQTINYDRVISAS